MLAGFGPSLVETSLHMVVHYSLCHPCVFVFFKDLSMINKLFQLFYMSLCITGAGTESVQGYGMCPGSYGNSVRTNYTYIAVG